jgi:hypothetical protein
MLTVNVFVSTRGFVRPQGGQAVRQPKPEWHSDGVPPCTAAHRWPRRARLRTRRLCEGVASWVPSGRRAQWAPSGPPCGASEASAAGAAGARTRPMAGLEPTLHKSFLPTLQGENQPTLQGQNRTLFTGAVFSTLFTYIPPFLTPRLSIVDCRRSNLGHASRAAGHA